MWVRDSAQFAGWASSRRGAGPAAGAGFTVGGGRDDARMNAVALVVVLISVSVGLAIGLAVGLRLGSVGAASGAPSGGDPALASLREQAAGSAARLASADREIERLAAERVALRSDLDAAYRHAAGLAAEHAEREACLREELAAASAAAASDQQMLDAFQSLSSDVLRVQSRQLVELAEAKYGALQQSTDGALHAHTQQVSTALTTLAERLAQLERERSQATTSLRTLVGELTVANEATRVEAARLASALRDTRVRGTWGEVQLRRVLELAGLTRHVDFSEQHTVDAVGDRSRPDVVVPLGNGRCVVIDAKAPLDRFLDAANAPDGDAASALHREHAKAVASHVAALASREYTEKINGAVDFVLLFLPGDPYLAAALDADPSLLESAAQRNVYLVTPTSLLPVLRGVALGWREQQASDAAAEILTLGRELHERLAVFIDHHSKVGEQLERTVRAFNQSVGSLDSRLAPTARKLAERGGESQRSLAAVVEIDTAIRPSRLAPSGAPPALAALAPADPETGLASC